MLELPTIKTDFLFENSQDFNQTTHAMSRDKDKGMCFKRHVDTWVYSKDDTMAHTRRLVVIS